MASLNILFPCSIDLFKSSRPSNKLYNVHKTLCASPHIPVKLVGRRLEKYEPSIWSFDFIESLATNKYTEENYVTRSHDLKEVVKVLISQRSNNAESPLATLELVDDLQRLGISYHFENEIKDALETLYRNYFKTNDKWNKMGLSLKALGFRLLRQQGYHLPQEIFCNMKGEIQNCKVQSYEDTVSMLNVYEASYLSVEDECILDGVRDLATKFLKESLEKKHVVDRSVVLLIIHALELPLHWRVPRVEAKWFIQTYEKRSDINCTLLELAKLDFNMVQSIHQEDLKHVSRWWKGTRWDQNLSFARDRLVENFMWTVGINYMPNFGYVRRTLTKVASIITIIDDIYDVYGTLDELQKFTDATARWDVNLIEQLPDGLKICFLGFYNSVNGIAYDTLTDTGFLIIPYLKKTWTSLCKSYLVEAQWSYSGHTPPFEEYLNNSCTSVAAPTTLMHSYFLTSSSFVDEALQCLQNVDDIVRYSSLIMRLCNDLATSSDELENRVPKSIQCYMVENGVSEEEARTYLNDLVNKTWKKLNKERRVANSPFLKPFIECVINLARTAQFMYGNGDRHDSPSVTKSYVLSLLIDPI